MTQVTQQPSKLAQVVFKTIYVVLGIIGVLGSLGYFARSFNANFYIFYTNLSNYLCLGFMIVSLIQTVKSFKSNAYGYSTTNPKLKFLFMIMIMVTCLVYNILLAKYYTIADYFFSMSNLTNHLILPIMFVLDWVLFYKRSETKWHYPLLSVIMPLIYVAFILIRALIIGDQTGAILYPYFFLDVSQYGIGGVIGWVCAIAVIFIILAYALYAFDHYKQIKQHFKNQNKN